MNHGMMDAFIIGVLIFLAGAGFMAMCHVLLLMTRHFLKKLDNE